MSILITEGYRQQNATLHQQNENYGTASLRYAKIVAQMMNANKVTELLDYGAGKCNLARAISDQRLVEHHFRYIPFEPADTRFSDRPEPAEMVACIDVLEHVEPELLDNVLDDLVRVTKSLLFVTVDCQPAAKTLPDGRNAHLIQQPPHWWLPKLMGRFDLRMYQFTGSGFMAGAISKGLE